MQVFGANEAAAEIGVDPRALRRFLRNNDSYRKAGMGGRYTFSASEVQVLKRAYLAAHPTTGRVVEKDDDPKILDLDPGLPLEKLTPKGLTPEDRAARREARAARQQRLKTRIDEVLAPRYDDEPVDLT
jgi:hypothetical protein